MDTLRSPMPRCDKEVPLRRQLGATEAIELQAPHQQTILDDWACVGVSYSGDVWDMLL